MDSQSRTVAVVDWKWTGALHRSQRALSLFLATFVTTVIASSAQRRSTLRPHGCGANMRSAHWYAAHAAAYFCLAKRASSMVDAARQPGGDTMN
jgi:hypothetical protein